MLLSLIIPIYNTQETKLHKCLDSIVCQNFRDFECLMIDDGSKSQTALIVDEYAAKDSRFVAIHKENGGVSSARNKGLELAKGEWICFVDSDDWIKPNHLASMVGATDKDIDIVLCGFEDVYVEETKVHSYEKKRYLNKLGCCKFLSETDVLWYMIPWDRMFRMSIIKKNNIRFNETLPISEDRLFCYEYIVYANGVATTDIVTYVHDATDDTSLSRKVVPLTIQKKRFALMSKAKHKIISSLRMTKAEATMLNSYNENLLVTMLNSGASYITIFSLLPEDTILIIKLMIKRIIYRCHK